MLEYVYIARDAFGQRTVKKKGVTLHNFSGGGRYTGNCDRAGYPIGGLMVGLCNSWGNGIGHGYTKGNCSSIGRGKG